MATLSEQEEAIEYFRGKLAQENNNAKHHQNLAALLAAQGDIKGAIQHCRQAVQLNPLDCKSRNDLGVHLLRLDLWEAAEACFLLVLKQNPHFLQAHVNLSAAYASRGDYRAALQHARTAVELAPHEPSVHRNMAALLDLTGIDATQTPLIADRIYQQASARPC